MSVRDLIPWGRNNGNNRVPNLFRDDDRDPFLWTRPAATC
jgi:HSP20 family protein